MKRWLIIATIIFLLNVCVGCSSAEEQQNIVATTMPVYTFSKILCEGTPILVDQLVQENVSCLHDYTLTVKHMKMLERADIVILSGGGIEGFLTDAITDDKTCIDASFGIEHHHHTEESESDHHHEEDPHFWLSIEIASVMAQNIYDGLINAYPQYYDFFTQNKTTLEQQFDQLQNYAEKNLMSLKTRKIITFHDGFSYMADHFGLEIIKAIEEESGSEASAKDLIEICNLVNLNDLPCVFTEKNGSDRAAKVIAKETDIQVYALDMSISGSNYFDAMYYNIDTLKEALG